MPESKLTCLDLWFRAGSSFEQTGEEGLAHFLEHMVFKGSACNKAGEFDRKIEALGGSSNAATGFDDVHFHVLVPPKVVLSALELLLDLVLNPSLDTNDYSTEREVVLEEIAQHNDQPDEKVFQDLLSICWPNHSYGRPILGLEKTLKTSDPERMRDFHNRLYIGKNCCLSIAGVIPNNIKTILENSLLSQLSESSETQCEYLASQELIFQKGRNEINVPRLESSRLLMAWPIGSANDQSTIMGADIATSLFAEGRRSRLIQRLREELQIVESIDMDVTVLEQGGLILLEAFCKESELCKVEKEIDKILRQSLVLPIEKKELDRASHLVANGLCFSLEASSQVASYAGCQNLWNRQQPLLDPLKYIQYWSEDHLKEKIFTKIQTDLSCTLIARPCKN